jgi:hypothetical protein
MRRFGTALAFMSVICAAAGVETAMAQVKVTTSALNVGNDSSAVCRVVNLNNFNIAPFIRVRSTDGTIVVEDFPGIPTNGAREVAAAGAGIRFCEAEFATAGQADNARLALTVRADLGTSRASLRGIRNGSSLGNRVITPSLQAGVGTNSCRAVNVATTAQTMTTRLYDEDGNVVMSIGPSSVQPNRAQSLSQSGLLNKRHCEVEATTGVLAKQIRVNLSVVDGETFDSLSPVEGE